MELSKTKTYTGLSGLTVSDVKEHLSISTGNTLDDDYIQTLINVSIDAVEDYIDFDVVPTDVTLNDTEVTAMFYTISQSNISGITEITYTDEDNVSYTASTASYRLHKYSDFWIIEFENQTINAKTLQIKYKSGYDADSIPNRIIHAVKVKVSELYDTDRQGYVMNNIKHSGLFEKLLSSYKKLVY